ncbi:DUF3800 domain-containing protein [Salmonella enterica]|nr:DUF3800 domain-containing protein [Salmonella enterica]EMD9725740.1 DUF3800 domain-containing protein [Salmonella enterica]MBA3221714.1 DUF3800 domain-containing protein [Salmonella enterica]
MIKFFDELIDFLHEKKCVFHMSSIHSRNISEEILNKIKSNLANSIIKSAGDDIRKSDVIERINSLSNQNFCQCFIHIFSLRNIIEKSLSFYGKEMPSALSEFNFSFDQKEEIKKVLYDEIFSGLYINLLRLDNLLRPYLVLNHDLSYSDKFTAELTNNQIKRSLRDNQTEFNVRSPITKDGYARPFYICSVFENYATCNSNNSLGLQIVDVLISNFNRALKGNFDNPIQIAKAIGKLTINSYIKGVYPIELIYLSEKLTLSKDELSLISMVEDMPYKLFGFKKDPDNIYKGI